MKKSELTLKNYARALCAIFFADLLLAALAGPSLESGEPTEIIILRLLFFIGWGSC
jgi:hypothetical protein